MNIVLTLFFIFFVGLMFIGVEILIPGFGAPGVTGIIFLVVGAVGLDKYPSEGIRALLMAFTVTIVIIIIFIKTNLKAKISEKFVLSRKSSSEGGYISVDSVDLIEGDKGIALTELRPSGNIMVNNKKYEAVSETGYIEKGKFVIVIRVEKSKVYVRGEKNV